MSYQRISGVEFFKKISNEKQARQWAWTTRFGKKGFRCIHCAHLKYYPHESRPEVRTCRQCLRQVRLRAGTIFQNSKLSLLVWLRAIHLVMQGKRGISALELKRVLKIGSYQTAWMMLHKIRIALRDREKHYKLKGVIEFDGTCFGQRKSHNQQPVLLAVESRDWIDEKARPRSRAGFAKVLAASESRQNAQSFVNQVVEKDSLLHTDGRTIYPFLENVSVEARKQTAPGNEDWLPWVHKFISNAKTWIRGTHHGVRSKYLDRYLAEYTYRFNRRHDPDSLFHRTLSACVLAAPAPAYALCR